MAVDRVTRFFPRHNLLLPFLCTPRAVAARGVMLSGATTESLQIKNIKLLIVTDIKVRIDSSSLSGFRFGWGRARLFTKKSYTKNCTIMFCHVREKIVPDVGASFLQDVVVFVVVRKAYDTRCSQAVPHPSTILARRCLTAVIGREQVCSSWYGRRQSVDKFFSTHSSSSFSPHTTSSSSERRDAPRCNHRIVTDKKYQTSNSH